MLYNIQSPVCQYIICSIGKFWELLGPKNCIKYSHFSGLEHSWIVSLRIKKFQLNFFSTKWQIIFLLEKLLLFTLQKKFRHSGTKFMTWTKGRLIQSANEMLSNIHKRSLWKCQNISPNPIPRAALNFFSSSNA